MYVHVVKKGETIYRIGRAVGVGADEIALVNGMVSERLVPGSSLLIPTHVPTLLHTYTVQPGDTLRKVAGRFHVPELIVQAANPGLMAEALPVGRVLTLPVPLSHKQAMEVNVRMEIAGDAEEWETLREAGASITSLSIANAVVQRDGSLHLHDGSEQMVPAVKSKVGAKRLLLITPDDEEGVGRVLSHAACRRAFFSDLRMWIDHEHFAGVHLELTPLEPTMRLALNGFIREVAARVHQKRGVVYVGVPAHPESDPDHPRYGAFDIAWLGQYADRIVWNAEEGYGRADGPPMALAPLHLIRRSLQQALQHVPRQKLLLGLPMYGFDWPRPYDPEQIARMTVYAPIDEEEGGVEAPKQVHWDDRAMTPMYTYHDETGELREVWYEDVRSLAAKLLLVHELKLAGVSCQVLGTALPGAWALLADTFEVRNVQGS